jgi:S1-C subfamily serine protease
VHNYIDAQKAKGNEVDLGTNDGVYIAKVEEGGAGEEAGLQEGDVITNIDNRKVTKMAELQEFLASKRPGDKVKVTYLRKKSKHEKTVTLKNAQGNTSVVKNADLDVLGATFKEVTETQKKDLNINYGLEVMKVNNGAFKEAGIAKGFIIQRANEQAVKTVDDLEKIVKEASTSKEPVVYIQGLYPTGKKKYFAVSLSEE